MFEGILLKKFIFSMFGEFVLIKSYKDVLLIC